MTHAVGAPSGAFPLATSVHMPPRAMTAEKLASGVFLVRRSLHPWVPTGPRVPSGGVQLGLHQANPSLTLHPSEGRLLIGQIKLINGNNNKDSLYSIVSKRIEHGDICSQVILQAIIENPELAPAWFGQYDHVLFPGTVWQTIPPAIAHADDPSMNELWVPGWCAGKIALYPMTEPIGSNVAIAATDYAMNVQIAYSGRRAINACWPSRCALHGSVHLRYPGQSWLRAIIKRQYYRRLVFFSIPQGY